MDFTRVAKQSINNTSQWKLADLLLAEIATVKFRRPFESPLKLSHFKNVPNSSRFALHSLKITI